jgi:hypothetical protein
MPMQFYPREREAEHILTEAGCAPGPVWTDVGNLAPTKIQSPDRLVRRESVYRLSYPGHKQLYNRPN